MNPLFWNECFSRERENIQTLIKQLKSNKARIETMSPDLLDTNQLNKLTNINKYINALEGLLKITQNHWNAVQSYLMKSDKRSIEMHCNLEFYKKRAEYLDKIIHQLTLRNNEK